MNLIQEVKVRIVKGCAARRIHKGDVAFIEHVSREDGTTRVRLFFPTRRSEDGTKANSRISFYTRSLAQSEEVSLNDGDPTHTIRIREATGAGPGVAKAKITTTTT